MTTQTEAERLADGLERGEPVAWMWRCKPYCNWPEWSVSLKRPADSGRDGNKRTEGYEDVPLYATPQPPRAVGTLAQPLTDEQIDALPLPPSGTATVRDLVRIIESAHGITKGNT